jgi:hypothetical protein
VFLAGDGNDRLYLGPGDRAHGGGGHDLAILPGLAADYALVEEEGRVILNGPDGPVWLVDVEVAEFTEEPGVFYAVEGS